MDWRIASGASTTLIGSTEIKITLHSTAPAWDIANPAGGAWPIGTLTGVNNANDNNGIYAFSGVDRTLISNAWDSVRPGTGTDFKFGVFGTGTGATQLLPGTRLVRAGIFMPQSAPAKIQFDILPLPS